MKTFRVWWDFTDPLWDVTGGQTDVQALNEKDAEKKFKKAHNSYYPKGKGYEIAGVEEIE